MENIGIDIESHQKPVSSESDLKNAFVSILHGNEEFVLSIDGKIIGSNLEAVNLSGYEEWEVIGKYFTIFYLPEEVEANVPLEHLKKAEESAKISFEGWKLKKRGVKFFARFSFLAIRNSLGELTAYRLVVKDITHKVVYDGKLQKIKEKYLSIYNNAFVGIVTVSSEDFHVIHINSKAREILGDKSENLKNSFASDDEFENFSKRLYEGEVIKGLEFKIKSSGNEERWASLDCRLHANENTIEGVIIDITKLRRQEAEINKLTKEVNTFIYHASHELRAPIATILGVLNLLVIENSDKIVANYVTMIRERVKAQDQLLKDLTGVIYNNTSPLQYDDFDFKENISEILAEFYDVYPEVKTDIKIAINVPFKTDKIRLRTIIRNILSNSFKYNSKVEPQIQIGVSEEGSRIKISIEDNGIGMTDDQQMMVFSLFNRMHEGYPGNGLGLYLVKSTLNKLNGQIRIKSKKNFGTEVLITL
jgi:PAS domain S-box-containing protein